MDESVGYNLCLGGGTVTGLIQSKETRDKISKTTKGKKLSSETKINISKAKKGDKNPMFGTISPMRGKKRSQESIEKSRKASLGRKHSEETKLKLSQANEGENNSMFGVKHTEESKIKIKNSWNNRCIIICPHCSRQSKNASQMKRWHFDNCKFKII